MNSWKIPRSQGIWYSVHPGLHAAGGEMPSRRLEAMRSSTPLKQGEVLRFGVWMLQFAYPLVNVYITMENPLFLWPFSIPMLVYQRVQKTVNIKDHQSCEPLDIHFRS